MEWSEVDLDAAEWRISEEKMKMRRPHINSRFLTKPASEIYNV
jgi:hypothetical protein